MALTQIRNTQVMPTTITDNEISNSAAIKTSKLQDGALFERTTNKGVANGYASLDASGKLTASQLPSSLVGAVVYQGVWNATTNTPAIASGVGTKGQYYKVSTAGTTSIDGNANWSAGDLIIFDGTVWEQVQGGSSDVISVFGRVGAVTLQSSDVTTALGFTPYSAANPNNYISANQTITVSGDATGSGTTSITLTLANSGVVAGTYTKVTVDAKGRVTTGNSLNATDINTALGFTVQNTTHIIRETPSGAVNGTNTTFTLANTPIAGSEMVFVNGMLQDAGTGNDYTITGATITMLYTPLTNDKIRVSYIK
jgi:hypothetical protein